MGIISIPHQGAATHGFVTRISLIPPPSPSCRLAAGFEDVFASIQSLNANDLEALDPSHFDVVIVDEFHHAAANSNERVLTQLQPCELLGLTATPKHTDGLSIPDWFDGRMAAELRLWDAIDQQHLSPFVHYGTDLGSVHGVEVAATANGELSPVRPHAWCVMLRHGYNNW